MSHAALKQQAQAALFQTGSGYETLPLSSWADSVLHLLLVDHQNCMSEETTSAATSDNAAKTSAGSSIESTEGNPNSGNADIPTHAGLQSEAEEPASGRHLAFVLIIVLPLLMLMPHVIALALPSSWLWLSDGMAWFGAILTLLMMTVYAVRHYSFALHRLFFDQRQPYLDISTAHWPAITVLVMAHNEARVIEGSLLALLNSDYPADRLTIKPVNDRSTDNTGAILDSLAARFPGRIHPLHRREGTGGKPAALAWACEQVSDSIIVIFDADYLPGKGLLKQLVSPFFDPEVGATMGRVVPLNARSNLLTRTLALERCAGYQISQQARQNLQLTAQYGGTVGAVRTAALQQVGGWSIDCLAEDTDLTIRLRCAGWRVVYQNRAECYEEVPEEWQVRMRQLSRWTQGHHHVFLRQWATVVNCKRLRPVERLDAMLLLSVFLLSPITLLGWSTCLYLYFRGDNTLSASLALSLSMMMYCGMGNFSSFFEISAGAILDRSRSSLIVMPFMILNFLVSTLIMSRGIFKQSWNTLAGKQGIWIKTKRYRKPVEQIARSSETPEGGSV